MSDDDPRPDATVLPFVRPARRDVVPPAKAPRALPADDDDAAGDAMLLADLEAMGLDERIDDAERAALRGDPHACEDLPALRNARALRSLLRGDREAAFAEWQALIDEDPRASNALMLRRIYREREGDFPGALADLDAMIALWPKDAALYTARGLLHGHLEDHARACADFEHAAALAPNHHESWMWVGHSRAALGHHAAAVRALGRAIKLAPWRAPLYELRATSYFWQDKKEEALRDLDRCLELDPRCASAYKKRSLVRPWPEGAAAMLADFDAALALEPWDRHTLRMRAMCHAHLGDLRRAEADLFLAIALLWREPPDAYDKVDDADLHAFRAEVRMKRGAYRDAAEDLTQVIRLQRGRDAAMFLRRAEARRKAKDLLGAAADYASASLLDHVTRQALWRSMEEHRDAGRRDAYLEDLEILLLMNPRDPDALAERARVHEEAEEYEAARRCLDQALEGAEDRHDLLLRRARVWALLDEYTRAVEDLTRALAVAPVEAEYLGYRGVYRALADGPSPEAEADVDRAVQYAPDDPTAHYLRAWYLDLAGRPDEAERERALRDACMAELERRADEER
jgi:tetratricopeptide (TPR) repeat protein